MGDLFFNNPLKVDDKRNKTKKNVRFRGHNSNDDDDDNNNNNNRQENPSDLLEVMMQWMKQDPGSFNKACRDFTVCTVHHKVMEMRVVIDASNHNDDCRVCLTHTCLDEAIRRARQNPDGCAQRWADVWKRQCDIEEEDAIYLENTNKPRVRPLTQSADMEKRLIAAWMAYTFAAWTISMTRREALQAYRSRNTEEEEEADDDDKYLNEYMTQLVLRASPRSNAKTDHRTVGQVYCFQHHAMGDFVMHRVPSSYDDCGICQSNTPYTPQQRQQYASSSSSSSSSSRNTNEDDSEDKIYEEISSSSSSSSSSRPTASNLLLSRKVKPVSTAERNRKGRNNKKKNKKKIMASSSSSSSTNHKKRPIYSDDDEEEEEEEQDDDDDNDEEEEEDNSRRRHRQQQQQDSAQYAKQLERERAARREISHTAFRDGDTENDVFGSLEQHQREIHQAMSSMSLQTTRPSSSSSSSRSSSSSSTSSGNKIEVEDEYGDNDDDLFR